MNNPNQELSLPTAALYARVSTDQQVSGLETQIKALKDYCIQNGITSYELFCDENQSGAKVSRPELNKLMSAVREGRVKKVIVFALAVLPGQRPIF